MDYELWDVFTAEPFAGNPLAVAADARGLSDAEMQRVANEFNLSETSFVLPSGVADARARYFTPTRELPVAGHPSVGTVFALERAGVFAGRDRVTLELAVGSVEMTLERSGGGGLSRVWMDQGVPELRETFPRDEVAAALGLGEGDLEPGLPVQLGSAGNSFLLVPVASLGALARVRVSPPALSELLPDGHRGVFAFTRVGPGPAIRARKLGASPGVVAEDPATGSAHGPLGAYLAAHTDLLRGGDRAGFVSYQGVEMGRKSELFVRLERKPAGVRVSVGGAATRVGEGTLFL